MALRGLLYRKLQKRQTKAKLKAVEKQTRKISKGTHQLLGKLNKAMEKELSKSEHSTDAKMNSISKSLQTLAGISKTIVRQNQKIISLLEKKKKVSFSV